MKNFNYKIIKTLPLIEGIEFLLSLKKTTTRKFIMANLIKTNPSCVCCEVKATKLCLGEDSAGGLHWDFYNDEDIALTWDHIIPKSKGGNNTLSNSQVLCKKHNEFKSNNDDRIFVLKTLYENGINYQLETKKKSKPSFRVEYWKSLDFEIFKKLEKLITEQSSIDEDCGEQYVYYFNK